MKKVLTSSITSTVAMPIKSGTLSHLQAAYQEALDAIAKNLIPNYQANTVYILAGCKNTGSGLSYIISSGALYYNGEVYLVDSATFTASSGQVAVASVATSYLSAANADPVEFTDGVSRNVHEIKKVALASGVSGSGIADFSDFKATSIALVNDQQGALPSSYTVKFDQDKAVFFSSAAVDTNITFDFTNAIPGAVVRLKWAYGASRALSVTTPSGATVIQENVDLSQVASKTNIFYALYAGVNAAGNHEVSIALNSI
jgi:hypothetical protein